MPLVILGVVGLETAAVVELLLARVAVVGQLQLGLAGKIDGYSLTAV